LFRFQREQTILDVGGVKIGGNPGDLPIVLIGSLFHLGHKIVQDRKLGIFDRRDAEQLIEVQMDMSQRTGIPCMLDVVAETPNALIRYIDFVSEITDIPFLINGQDMSVRIPAANHVVEVGLQERAIYNSINYALRDEELKAIRETGLRAAIVQAFNPSNPSPEGMISILKGAPAREGLLEVARRAGIEKPLVFLPVLDVPSIGFAARAIHLAREEFGKPAGTAPIGVIGRWNNVDKLSRYAKRACRAGAAALVQTMGANFVIYGSIAKAREVFPVCAMADAAIAYNARSLGMRPLTSGHPLYRIF
jgi:tetrahydromethanopterin S-methyltransferase subunit H